MTAGVAFGEQSFLSSTASKASVRAVDFCELMFLGREQLSTVTVNDPALERHVSSYMAEQMHRYAKTNKMVSKKEHEHMKRAEHGRKASLTSAYQRRWSSSGAGSRRMSQGDRESDREGGSNKRHSFISKSLHRLQPQSCAGGASPSPRPRHSANTAPSPRPQPSATRSSPLQPRCHAARGALPTSDAVRSTSPAEPAATTFFSGSSKSPVEV